MQPLNWLHQLPGKGMQLTQYSGMLPQFRGQRTAWNAADAM